MGSRFAAQKALKQTLFKDNQIIENMKLISQGAEAHIFENKDSIIKLRKSKGYRNQQLDKSLIKQRTKKEVKLLQKAVKLINVPNIINFESDKIVLERIKGKKISSYLEKLKDKKEIAKQIGQSLHKLHESDIIHGDLTTSNMIYYKDKVYFIDFGLGYESKNLEDKAVDLHVLKEALVAKHPSIAIEFFGKIISAYKDKAVIKRLEAVEKRGRYKKSY